jgi:hypothetical protein
METKLPNQPIIETTPAFPWVEAEPEDPGDIPGREAGNFKSMIACSIRLLLGGVL